MNKKCPICNHGISYWDIFKYQFSLKGIKCSNCNTRIIFNYGILGRVVLFVALLLFIQLPRDISWIVFIIFVFLNPLLQLKFAKVKETADEIISKENEKIESEFISIHMILRIRRIVLYTFIFLIPALIISTLYITVNLNDLSYSFRTILIPLFHYISFLIFESIFIVLVKPKFVYKVINSFYRYNGYFVAWLSLSFLAMIMLDFIVLDYVRLIAAYVFALTILLALFSIFFQYQENRNGKKIKINLSKMFVLLIFISLISYSAYLYFYDEPKESNYIELSQEEIWNHVFTGPSGVISDTIDFVQVNYEENLLIINKVNSNTMLDCEITETKLSCITNDELWEINVVGQRSYSLRIFKSDMIQFQSGIVILTDEIEYTDR